MIKLSININKVALIRNSRDGNYPDLQRFATRCLELGASGITVHPRPDQRHVRFGDISVLAEVCRSFGQDFNVEGYPSKEFLALMCEIKPDQCTLVPDAANQLTSDHGWDFNREEALLFNAIADLKRNGIRTSLFVEHDTPNIGGAKVLGADRVELFTGPYAKEFGGHTADKVHAAYVNAACTARTAGLGVNAGHDLNLTNLASFLTVPGILEVSIGHAFITDCLYFGIEETMNRYLNCRPLDCNENTPS